MMARQWYVEIYSHDGVKAKEHKNLADFAATSAFVKKFKAQPSSDILRVLAPASATDQELQQLRENGATLV
jgi:hypothetical protein